MGKLYILLLLLIAGSGSVKAQSALPSSSDGPISVLDTSNIKGTYQLEVIDTRAQPFFPPDLYSVVATNRLEDKTVYIQLGTQVRLKILSNTEIHKPDFKPLDPVAFITLIN